MDLCWHIDAYIYQMRSIASHEWCHCSCACAWSIQSTMPLRFLLCSFVHVFGGLISLCMLYIGVAFHFQPNTFHSLGIQTHESLLWTQWQCKYLFTFFLFLFWKRMREKCKTVLRLSTKRIQMRAAHYNAQFLFVLLWNQYYRSQVLYISENKQK